MHEITHNGKEAGQAANSRSKQNERLAFSVQETADMLGVCYNSIFNLIKRGKLQAATGLRRRLIPRSEIERFLSE